MDPDLTPPPGRWSAYAIAQYSLGVAYWFGAGVEQDDAAAAVRYLLAAEQGNAAAQFMLGVAYGQGRGVTQNAAMAVPLVPAGGRTGRRRRAEQPGHRL